MFCNQCGTNMPDGSAHCTQCGAPMQAAPQYAPQPQRTHPIDPQKPGKDYSLFIRLTMLVSVILLLVSIVVPLAIPVCDIPVLGMINKDAVDDMEDAIDKMKDEWDSNEEMFEAADKELDGKVKNSWEKSKKAVEKMLDNYSLLNLRSAVKATAELEKLAEDELDGNFALSGIDEADEAMDSLMGVILGISIGLFVLPLLFTLLGGLKKSLGLSITALIFTAISQFLLCGVVMVIISILVNLVMIVLCAKNDKA